MQDLHCNHRFSRDIEGFDCVGDGVVQSICIVDVKLASLEHECMRVFVRLHFVIKQRLVDVVRCLPVACLHGVENNDVTQTSVQPNSDLHKIVHNPQTNAKTARQIHCLPKKGTAVASELVSSGACTIAVSVQENVKRLMEMIMLGQV